MNAYFVKFSETDSAYVLVQDGIDHEWQYAMWSALSLFVYEAEVSASQLIDGFADSMGAYPMVRRVPDLDGESFSLGQLVEMGKAVPGEMTEADLAEQVTAIWLSTEI